MAQSDEPDDESIEINLGSTHAGVAPVPSLTIANAATSEVSLSRLPQQLGRYTLIKRLGIGGMAEVFLAEQLGAAGFKKQCVVKRMLGHLSLQPKFVEMFLREAHLASTLHHANIVQIWDLGEVDGQYFIAMEYIDGMPLNLLARTAWRNGRALPMEVICCALADAAEGLAAAHNRIDPDGKPAPIIHRDISPDNLMIDRDGVTKIVDFGIARTNDSERTQHGELKGKVPFMPLEQLRGELIDVRADVYALGVTAYWLLTGKRPFTAATDMALIEVIATQSAKPPIEVNPQVPRQLNDLVMKMLERERDNRISSVRDIASALEHVLASRKTLVAPTVRAIMDEPDRAEQDDPPSAASGFVPSTPHTDAISSGWRQRHPSAERTDGALRAANASAPMGHLLMDPPPTIAIADEAPEEPAATRSRRPIAIAAGATLLVAVGLALTLSRQDPTAVPVVPPPLALSVQPLPPPPLPDSADKPTDAPADAPTDAPPDKPLDKLSEKAPGAKRDVVVKAPPEVQWLYEGKLLGAGNKTLKVPVGAKALVAVDKKRAVRTTVAIGAGPIDYAKLPRGKLQPRAKPFADVFLGKDSLGATPFPAVDVVAGTYAVKFVYKGKEIVKTVVVAPGSVGRPAVDFTQPP